MRFQRGDPLSGTEMRAVTGATSLIYGKADDVDSTRMSMLGKGVGSVCAAKSVALMTTPQRTGVTLGK